MPSLIDAINTTNGLEGYAPGAAPLRPSLSPAPPVNREPERNAMMRCPVPPLWQASPDALRQFYMNGQVPQARIMLPPAPVPISTVAPSTTNVQITSTSGSAASSSQTGSQPAQSTQVIIKTPVLPPGNKFVGSVNLAAKSLQLLSIAAQGPCRVQLYGTAAAQSSDLGRGLDAAPGAGTAQNIICDVVLDTAPYKWSFQNRIGANADNPQAATLYVTVTNLDQKSAVEQLTMLYVPLES